MISPASINISSKDVEADKAILLLALATLQEYVLKDSSPFWDIESLTDRVGRAQ